MAIEAARVVPMHLEPSVKGRVALLGIPDYLNKADPGKSVYRAQFLPTARPRRPRGFWDASWCFYEITVGTYLFQAHVWEAQFFMATRNKKCGSGKYADQVRAILDGAAKRIAGSRSDFDAQKQFAFLTIVGRETSPVSAGKALAWIISETLPRLELIPET